MTFVIIYVTTKNVVLSRKIAAVLVKEKIVACANIISKIETVYRWKGKVQKHSESVIIMKTKKSLVRNAIKRIKEMHSYEVPCIITIDIDGDKDFLKWIEEETK